MLRKSLLALAVVVGLASSAFAQSGCPNIAQGAVLTAAQWNACFASKQNTLGYAPVNKAGDTMLGRLTMTPSTTLAAGLNISPGTAPTSPSNGDMWMTAAGLFFRANGVTIGPVSAAAASIQVSATAIVSGTSNGVLFNNAGVVGNTSSVNNAVLVTNGSGVPSLSVTLPAGLTFTTSLTGPKLIGGTGTTSTLTLQTTSGVGTTNSDMIFLVGNNGATEAARILNSGFVGIGTPSPAVKLSIEGNSASDIINGKIKNLNSAGVSSWNTVNDIGSTTVFGVYGSTRPTAGALVANTGFLYSNSALVLMADQASGVIKFATGGSAETMRLDASGNLAIGTTTAGAQLHTTGTVRFAAMTVAGCLANDTSGNVTGGNACSGGGGGLPTGGTVGQALIKYDATNDHALWKNEGAFNISADPATDCTGISPTVLSTVAAAFKTIENPQGCTVQVNANDTLLPSTTVKLSCGSTVQVNNGITLTIKGPFPDPGPCRLFTFTGTGKVVGIAAVRPEWFGARGQTTFTGTGSGTNLTASNVVGTITAGDTVRGTGVPANTVINSQSSGTTGGAGVYVTSNSTTSSGASLTAALADSGVPIQSAINSVQASIGQTTDKYSIRFACVTYEIITGITYTPTLQYGWDIAGCGSIGQMTTLLGRSTASAGSVMTLASGGLSNWSLRNLVVQQETGGSGKSAGIAFGTTGATQLTGFHPNQIQNIHVSGFDNNIVIQNAQWLDFDRISVSPGDITGTERLSSYGMVIQNAATDGGDTGSIFVRNSKLTGAGHNATCNTAADTVLIISNTATHTAGTAVIAGVHFNDNEWYGGAKQLNMTTGSAGIISDVFVNPSNQFEGQTANNCDGVVGTITGTTGQLKGIHINNSYFSGHGHRFPVQFNGGLNSTMFGLLINNNFIAGNINISIEVLCNGQSGTIGNAGTINIIGNQIFSPASNTGLDAIYTDTCKQQIISNNNLAGGTIGTPLRRSTVLTNTCNYVTTSANNGGGLTTGAAFITGGACTNIGGLSGAGNYP